MRGVSVLLLLVLSACSIAHEDERNELVVVTGKLENLSYESAGIPDDVIGHGYITANLYVSEVHSGLVDAQLLRIEYYNHTYLQEQEGMTFRLKRVDDGTYIACASEGSSGYKCEGLEDDQ